MTKYDMQNDLQHSKLKSHLGTQLGKYEQDHEVKVRQRIKEAEKFEKYDKKAKSEFYKGILDKQSKGRHISVDSSGEVRVQRFDRHNMMANQDIENALLSDLSKKKYGRANYSCTHNNPNEFFTPIQEKVRPKKGNDYNRFYQPKWYDSYPGTTLISYNIEKARKIREKRLAKAVESSDMFNINQIAKNHSKIQSPVKIKPSPKAIFSIKQNCDIISPYNTQPREVLTGVLAMNSTKNFMTHKRK